MTRIALPAGRTLRGHVFRLLLGTACVVGLTATRIAFLRLTVALAGLVLSGLVLAMPGIALSLLLYLLFALAITLAAISLSKPDNSPIGGAKRLGLPEGFRRAGRQGNAGQRQRRRPADQKLLHAGPHIC